MRKNHMIYCMIDKKVDQVSEMACCLGSRATPGRLVWAPFGVTSPSRGDRSSRKNAFFLVPKNGIRPRGETWKNDHYRAPRALVDYAENSPETLGIVPKVSRNPHWSYNHNRNNINFKLKINPFLFISKIAYYSQNLITSARRLSSENGARSETMHSKSAFWCISFATRPWKNTMKLWNSLQGQWRLFRRMTGVSHIRWVAN